MEDPSDSSVELLTTDNGFAWDDHPYSRFEVPLENIKKEIDEVIASMPADANKERIKGAIEAMQTDPDVVKVPIFLRDNKPKLRKKKPPKPQPKSILPKAIKPLPATNDPPANCKGVLVVQDIKFCTMYMPKNGHNIIKGSSLPIPRLPPMALPLPPPKMLPQPTPKTPAQPSPPPPLPPIVIAPPPPPVAPAEEATPSAKGETVPPALPDPPFSILMSNNYNSQFKTCPLVVEVQKILQEKLPLYWFSAADKYGVNVMLISIGKEKAIQRRVYVSIAGSVEISVHCKPLAEDFVKSIVKKAGKPISLTVQTVKQFSEWVLEVVKIVRDFQTCCGIEHPGYADSPDEDTVRDENPYQECTFVETLRSKNCLKLIELRKRRCSECSKSHSKRRRLEKQKKLSIKESSEQSEVGPSSEGSASLNSSKCETSPIERSASPTDKKGSTNKRQKRKQSKKAQEDSCSDV